MRQRQGWVRRDVDCDAARWWAGVATLSKSPMAGIRGHTFPADPAVPFLQSHQLPHPAPSLTPHSIPILPHTHPPGTRAWLCPGGPWRRGSAGPGGAAAPPAAPPPGPPPCRSSPWPRRRESARAAGREGGRKADVKTLGQGGACGLSTGSGQVATHISYHKRPLTHAHPSHPPTASHPRRRPSHSRSTHTHATLQDPTTSAAYPGPLAGAMYTGRRW